MGTLRQNLLSLAIAHEERVKNDPRYAVTVAIMKSATKSAEPSKHYDRDGYCDNPSRGY